MSIRTLPSQIINQISAGEIIDSPAAVVKELMENSIDSGATRIDIHVDYGGIKSINLCDNGCGISKSDLKKTIKNHSTSKIYTVADLGNISTLGFRGEALASISAVSRFMISSSISSQEYGWQLYSEKSFSKILQFQPIAHPQGTSINVLDLFYNIPVRRKYLKTEHAEFIKICETIKKITLSRQDITVIVSHNDKVVKKYFAIQHVADHVSRLRSLFGKSFVTRLHYLEYNFKQLELKGWISLRSMKKKGKFLRYYYVNTRIVQSKVLNHAVSQAVNEIFGSNEFISVILYLQVPFSDIDVNIHPNKREIHFYKFRIIHSFIYQSILHTLNKLVSKTTIKANLNNWTVNNKNTAGINLFSYNQRNSLNHSTCLIDKKNKASSLLQLKITESKKISFFNQIIAIIKKRYVLVSYQEELALVSLKKVMILLIEHKLNEGIKMGLKIQYLLNPKIIKYPNQKLEILSKYRELLKELGFDISIQSEYCTIHVVPFFLKSNQIKILVSLILDYLTVTKKISKNNLSNFISNHIEIDVSNWSYLQTISNLTELENNLPDILQSPPSSLLQKIYITPLISELK